MWPERRRQKAMQGSTVGTCEPLPGARLSLWVMQEPWQSVEYGRDVN